jgi:hypothetical protein
LTLRTVSDNQNIFFYPNGNGSTVVGANIVALQSGKDIIIMSGNGTNSNIYLIPSLNSTVQLLKCSNCSTPTIMPNAAIPLRFRAFSTATESVVRIPSDLEINSTKASGGGAVVRSGVGQSLRVQGSMDQDIFLSPGGKVVLSKINSNSSENTSGSMTFQSSASGDLLLETVRAVLNNTRLTSQNNTDLMLSGNFIRLGDSTIDADVVINGTTPTLRTQDGADLVLQAVSADNLKIYLNSQIQMLTDTLYSTANGHPFQLKTQGQTSLVAASLRNVILQLERDGAVIIQGADPAIVAQHIQFSGSAQPLVLQTANNSDANVYLKPDGLGVVQLRSTDLSSPSTISANGTLTMKGASSSTVPDIVIGPPADYDGPFTLRVLSDATTTNITSTQTELRLLGIGSSPNIVLNPATDGSVIIDNSATTPTLTSFSSDLMLDGVSLFPGGGAVEVGGDRQEISSSSDSQTLQVRGFNGGQTTGFSLSSLSSTGDFVVEISTSETSSSFYGLTSTAGKTLTIATQTTGMDISMQTSGSGAVIIDGFLRLPVQTFAISCNGTIDNGKMWVRGEALQICMDGAVKTLDLE